MIAKWQSELRNAKAELVLFDRVVSLQRGDSYKALMQQVAVFRDANTLGVLEDPNCSAIDLARAQGVHRVCSWLIGLHSHNENERERIQTKIRRLEAQIEESDRGPLSHGKVVIEDAQPLAALAKKVIP